MNGDGKRPSISGPARFAISAIVVVVVALVAGVGASFLSGQGGAAAVAGPAVMFASIMAASAATGLWWWVKLDEAAREAHKWAFWWGGSAGMAIGAVLLLTLVAYGERAAGLAWIGDTPTQAFG